MSAAVAAGSRAESCRPWTGLLWDGTVVGVDIAQTAIDLAIRRSAGVSSGVLRFQCADANELPFAEGAFDAAVCVSVLAFCEEPVEVLKEVRRALRPGGRLVIACGDEDTRIYNVRDRDRGRRIERAIADRSCDPWIGRRLAHMLELSGFRCVRESVAADVERTLQPGSAGYVLAHGLREYLLTNANIDVDDYESWIADLRAAELDGSYCYAAMTFVYLAERERERGAGHDS
jgi:SAM-dependent methyltransferase